MNTPDESILETGDHVQGLDPNHLLDLRASGLNDETIKAAGLRSEHDPRKITALLGWSPKAEQKVKRLGAVLVIPFIDAMGQTVLHRIKPNVAPKLNGKSAKYLSPKGSKAEIYLPPGVAAMLDNSEVPLLITEGEKKALKATQEGFPTIGLIGVSAWNEAGKKKLLGSLERVAWKGRRVTIAFDSDGIRKDSVKLAEIWLAHTLNNQGADTRCLRIPDGPAGDDGEPVKLGLDDFLVSSGSSELHRLISEAVEADDPEGMEIKSHAATADPAEEAAALLTSGMQNGSLTTLFWRGAFQQYGKGRFVEVQTSEVRAKIIHHLNRKYHNVTTSVTTNILDQVRAQALVCFGHTPPCWIGGEPAGAFSPLETLVCRNGLVNLRTLDLQKATPRFFSTVATTFDFDPNAPKPERWFGFLDSIWGDDPESISMLQEWFGYCLSADTSQQKILLLLGPTRAGKGMVSRILMELVGRENCCGPTLSGLATNFGLWPLIGRTLAVIADARLSGRVDQSVVVERLLSISGEDSLTIDRKNLEPLTIKLLTRLMLSSNELPHLTDSSGALGGRIIPLHFSRSFYGKEDRLLFNKLLPELQGILLWAIGGWQRLQDRGFFVVPKSSADLIEQLGEITSPTKTFVKENCNLDAGLRIETDRLYQAFRMWCEAKGRKQPEIQSIFGRNLFAAFPDLKRTQPRDDDGGRYRAYEGIDLKMVVSSDLDQWIARQERRHQPAT